jgi:chemotaxis protein methyltransferase CheR
MRAPLDPGDVVRLRDLVRERVGLSFPQSRLPDVEWAVRKTLAETGLPDAAALYRLLTQRARHQEPLDALVSALNVSETHFHRDRSQIRALSERILPEIILRRRSQRRLRLWSAACSTGEEAYTLAILVCQQLPDLADWDVRILASDVNGRTLERARGGVYGPWSFRGVPQNVKHTWFVPEGDRYRVAPQLRAMVRFEQVNLVDDAPAWSPAEPWDYDLILCRNVLLYFDGSTARTVVGRLGACLDDHGWLLLSQVEAGLDLVDASAMQPRGGGAFAKVPSPPRAATPTPPRAAGPATPRAVDSLERHQPASATLPHRGAEPGEGALEAALGSEALEAPPGTGALDGGTGMPVAYREALALWRGKRPQEALRRLQLEWSHDQLAAPLHYLEGLILLDEGRAEQALAAFRRCTFVDPGFALGHLAQANLLARAGNRRRAATALEHAAGLVAGLDPEAQVFGGDDLRAGALLELVEAQRQLLGRQPEAVDA